MIKSLKNNIRNNIWLEVNLLRFTLIIPIISNKLAQIINGIKHEYRTVNSICNLGSSWKYNKTFCRNLHWSWVLFIARSKRDKKSHVKSREAQRHLVLLASLVKFIFKVNTKVKIHIKTDSAANQFPCNLTNERIFMC